MKKILFGIFTFLTIALTAPHAYAQPTVYSCVKHQCVMDANGMYDTLSSCEEKCPNALCERGFEPACNFTSICKTYGFVINISTMAAGLIALLMGLYGAFKYLTANGVSEELTKAQTVIINAIIGLVIVVVAYSVTRIILTVTDVGTICF